MRNLRCLRKATKVGKHSSRKQYIFPHFLFLICLHNWGSQCGMGQYEPEKEMTRMKTTWKKKQELVKGSCPVKKVLTAPILLLLYVLKKGKSSVDRWGTVGHINSDWKTIYFTQTLQTTDNLYLFKSNNVFHLGLCCLHYPPKQTNDTILFVTQKVLFKEIQPWLIAIP